MCDNKFEWDQFIKLGDMMGDGLHHESDGKWIVKEYNRLSKILLPEEHKELRRLKNENTDSQIKRLISEKKCKCGGNLKQSRSGSIIVYCLVCNARYKARKQKANNHK